MQQGPLSAHPQSAHSTWSTNCRRPTTATSPPAFSVSITTTLPSLDTYAPNSIYSYLRPRYSSSTQFPSRRRRRPTTGLSNLSMDLCFSGRSRRCAVAALRCSPFPAAKSASSADDLSPVSLLSVDLRNFHCVRLRP